MMLNFLHRRGDIHIEWSRKIYRSLLLAQPLSPQPMQMGGPSWQWSSWPPLPLSLFGFDAESPHQQHQVDSGEAGSLLPSAGNVNMMLLHLLPYTRVHSRLALPRLLWRVLPLMMTTVRHIWGDHPHHHWGDCGGSDKILFWLSSNV